MLKRKVSCTFKRKITLEIQERIYPLPSRVAHPSRFLRCVRAAAGGAIPRGWGISLAIRRVYDAYGWFLPAAPELCSLHDCVKPGHFI